MKVKVSYLYKLRHKTETEESLIMIVTAIKGDYFEGETLHSEDEDIDTHWNLPCDDIGRYWLGYELGHIDDYPEYLL